jgi:uncharacterized membrane-anchored protein YitT (DUF2179 family)
MSAGTTGIALVVNHMMGIPISLFILIFNVVMLCLGWFVLGKKFAMTTCFSSLFYPIALEVLNRTLGEVSLTDNMLLNVLFAGMGLGLSLGLVLRSGAATGGVDIPAVILKKHLNIPVSVSLWVCDCLIMVSQLLFHTAEDLLYGVLLLVVISMTLNKVMLLGTSKTEVKIVSQHSEVIREAILSRVDRGVTILHGEGGYLHEDTEVILSIVSNHELPRIEQLARSIDPDCFMIISSVTEVWGRGFSYNKYHQSKES